VRAGDLALMMRQETAVFKINVQQLKNLGLTESLRTGYRLSPRGRVVLASLKEFPL
jgi:ribosomal protein S19E (S16A)